MKFIKLLLKDLSRILIMFLSCMSIRQKHKWVFGSNMGYVGNSKYFLEYILDNKKEINAIWIADTKSVEKLLKSRGVKVYHRMSIKGLYHCLTAKVFIYNSYASEINIYASIGRTVRVNLWHGVGIKNIEHKITTGPLAKVFSNKSLLNKFRHIDHFIKPDLFLSTSPLMDEHFKKCFKIEDSSLIKTGYPRCDILNRSANDLTEYILKESTQDQKDFFRSFDLYDHIYMYMPTWRDGKGDFLEDSGIDLTILNKQMLVSKSLFIFKLHPSTNVDIDFSAYSNIVDIDSKIDVYPLLPFVNVLITDYSSIYYDFILLKNNNTILFPFDYEEYISSSRDLAFPYDEFTYGTLIYNFKDLIKVIDNRTYTANQEATELREKFWAHVNNDNSALIYSEIKKHIL